MDIKNPIAACLSNGQKLEAEQGGLLLDLHFIPPLSIIRVPLDVAAPAHLKVGG